MRHFYNCLIILMLAVSLSGCPGGDDEGVSLQDRYNQAQAIGNAGTRANQLIDVARDFYAAGDSAGGQKALDEAFEAAGEAEKPLDKAQAYNGVAAAEAEFGRQAKAEDALKEARRAASIIEDAGLKVEQLAAIAVTYGTKLDDPSKASAYLDSAKEAAEGIADPAIRAEAIVDLAGSHHDLGQAKEAAAMLATATEAAKQIEDPNKQAAAIGEVAAKATEMGAANAEELFDEAISVAESIDDAAEKANRLADLALEMHQAGDKAGAQALIKKATAASEQITEQAFKSEVQGKIDGYRNRMGG